MINEKDLIEALEKDKDSIYSHVFAHVDEDTKEKLMIDLIALINNVPKAGDWISCKEMLPEDGKYLTCDKHGNMHVFYHCKSYKYPFGIHPAHKLYFPVVAWQPLPDVYRPE